MSLRKFSELTPGKLAANRANAQRSTGPRRAGSRAHSNIDALVERVKVRDEDFRRSMVELGENPQEFDEHFRELLAVFEPANPLWAQQVEDLARLYWRRRRLERARDGILRRERERLEFERARREQNLRKDLLLPFEEAQVPHLGLLRMDGSPAQFEQALTLLEFIRCLIEVRDFSSPQPEVFSRLYGKIPRHRGNTLQTDFQSVCHAAEGHPPSGEGEYQHLRTLVEKEIRAVQSEYDLYRRENVEISAAMRDAALAPTGKDWFAILRQEVALDRAIDRKVKILMSMHRAFRDAPAGQEETATDPVSEADPGALMTGQS